MTGRIDPNTPTYRAGPLVTIKRRTIVAWRSRDGEQKQTGPLSREELRNYRQALQFEGHHVLYLVRCRPRYRGALPIEEVRSAMRSMWIEEPEKISRGWTEDTFTTRPNRDPSRL